MIEQNKNGIVVVVLLATLFGFIAGIVGSMIIKSYFGTNSAFWGELNFINNNLERPNLVINSAKKVVVAQDEKISKTISELSPSIVNIYKKKTISTIKEGLDLNNFYKKSDKIGSALIITSDGWILSDAIKSSEFNEKNKSLNLDKYIVIDANNSIYKIDKIALDPKTDYIFFHIDAKDLPVLNIANKNDINLGDTVLALNSDRDIILSTVSSVRDVDDYLSLSSDFYYDSISLTDEVGENFYSSFVFDFSGSLIMLIDKRGNLIPARVFNVATETLFAEGVIERPSLGVEYTDLSYLIYDDENKDIKNNNGALIIKVNKKSKKDETENIILPGDLIEELDKIVLDRNNNLSKIIMDYNVGDNVELKIMREAKEIILNVQLDRLE